MVFNFLKKHKRLTTSRDFQEAETSSPHPGGQYKRRRSPSGRELGPEAAARRTEDDIHESADHHVTPGRRTEGGEQAEDENGVLKFTEWNDESSVITLQLGNSTPSQTGPNLTSDTLKRLRRQSSQQTLNKWIRGRELYQSTQSIAGGGGAALSSAKKSSRGEERGGVVSTSRSIPSLLLPTLYNSKLDESLEPGDSSGDIYETVNQSPQSLVYGSSRPRPPILKPLDYYGSRNDLYQSNSEIYVSRSELYSPTKSDIYGSKNEFVFGGGSSSQHSRSGGGTRPSSIYSPSGTLTRCGSKSSGRRVINGQTGGGMESESGNFYESDSGVSSLYEPLSFNGHNGQGGPLMALHSTSQHRLDFLAAAAGGSQHRLNHVGQHHHHGGEVTETALRLMEGRGDHGELVHQQLHNGQVHHYNDHHHHHHHHHARQDSKTSSLQSTGSRGSSDSASSSSARRDGGGLAIARQDVKSVSFQNVVNGADDKDYDDVSAAINEVFDSLDSRGTVEEDSLEEADKVAEVERSRRSPMSSGKPRGASVTYSSTIAQADGRKQPTRKFKSFSESRRASAGNPNFFNGYNNRETKRFSLKEDNLMFSTQNSAQYSEVNKANSKNEDNVLTRLVDSLNLPIYLELLLVASDTGLDKLLYYIQDVMPELTESRSGQSRLSQDTRSLPLPLPLPHHHPPSAADLADLLAKQLSDKIDLLRCRLSVLESEWNENNLTFSQLQSKLFSLVTPEQMSQLSNYRKDLETSTRLLHLLSSRLARSDLQLTVLASRKLPHCNQLQKLLFEREQERLEEVKVSTLDRLDEAKHLKSFTNSRRDKIISLLHTTSQATTTTFHSQLTPPPTTTTTFQSQLTATSTSSATTSAQKFSDFSDNLVDIVFTQEEVKSKIKTLERQRSSLKILFNSVPVSIL